MRKLTSISAAFIVAAGVMVAAPATAATTISNGVACTKLGVVKKVSGSKYKCATNPLVTSKKRVWLTIDCLNSAVAYKKALKSALEISAALAAQIPIIDLGIAKEMADKAELQIKLDSANLSLTAIKEKLALAKTTVAKRTLTSAVTSWTSAVRAYTAAINSTVANIRKLEAAKLLAINQPLQLKDAVADTKANARLICTKGL